MDFDNALSDSMVKRVISFVVAVIIVSVVAIPVVNAITDENGSDGGDTDTITYTNTGDYYYKSATADSNEHIIVLEYTEITEDPASITTVLKIDGTTIINQTLGDGANSPYLMDSIYLFGWSQSQTIGLSILDGGMWIINNADNTSEEIYGTVIEDRPFENGYTIHSQYVISDGVLSFTDDGDNERSYPIDYYMGKTGEYVLADRPVVSASNNTLIRLWIDYDAEDTDRPGTYMTFSIYGAIESGNIVSDTESISLNVNQKTVQVSSSSIESTLTSSKVGDLITLDNVSCEGYIDTNPDIDSVSTSSTQFVVPTTVTVEEEGGGSDSSSNMTNTIIKTIPIFLVLGLLIAFALPMVQGKFE